MNLLLLVNYYYFVFIVFIFFLWTWFTRKTCIRQDFKCRCQFYLYGYNLSIQFMDVFFTIAPLYSPIYSQKIHEVFENFLPPLYCWRYSHAMYITLSIVQSLACGFKKGLLPQVRITFLFISHFSCCLPIGCEPKLTLNLPFCENLIKTLEACFYWER